jgi:small-conductance mechanosensitive channel
MDYFTYITDYLAPLLVLFDGHPWLKGGAVIVVTFIFASVVSWIIFKLLKIASKKTKSQIDDRLVSIVRIPIYYSLLITGFTTGTRLMPFGEEVSGYIGNGFQSFGIFIWTIAIIRISKIIMNQLAWGKGYRFRLIRPQTLPLFDNLGKLLIIALALYITFEVWGIDMTAWLASAGVIGIAIGFAAKDTLANLFSGVFILADTPYKIGDYIVLDGNQRGKVTHIGIRSTRILTRDDVEITIPNAIMGNSKITNQSGGPHPKFRIRLKIGVAYGSDIDKVRELLVDIAINEPLITQSPSPRVRFRHFGASSLDLELMGWIEDPELRGRTLDKLNTTVYKRFNQENIEIPYSKQDLYIKELPRS